MNPSEARVSIGNASLFVRAIGQGPAVIVLHGGPDFDHRYFLPEMDRLADAYRLVYYDQRGRGRSGENVRPEDVSLQSEIDDLDHVRRHFGLDAPILLGHSWGALLALEYALRHPSHVSHLILMNPAPMSAADFAILRTSYAAMLGEDLDRQRKIAAGAAYRAGDPEAEIARYRLHFKPALKRSEDYETLMARMRAAFVEQGAEGILMSRAVEDQLLNETWRVPDYDLLSRLRTLRIPALILTGDSEFIPAEIADRIAQALPSAELVTLENCGHFADFERPNEVRAAIEGFLASSS